MKMSKKSGAVLAACAAAFVMSSAASVKIASADEAVVHCMGVNSCKGLNSCKGANNACKGQGSCKGTGFVDTTAEVCKQIGGKVS